MPYTIERATTEDAPAIAKIFLSNESDSFLQLQFGTADPEALSDDTAESLVESIEKEGQVFIVARDDDSGEVVGYAQWSLPRDEFEMVMMQTPQVIRSEVLPGLKI